MIPAWLLRLSRSRSTALVWTFTIFLLMVIPGSALPNQGFFGIKHLDKLVHAILFGGFLWLWHYARPDAFGKQHFLGLFAVSVAYGSVMECVQLIFTNRAFDIWDIVADTAGAALVAFWLHRWGKK